MHSRYLLRQFNTNKPNKYFKDVMTYNIDTVKQAPHVSVINLKSVIRYGDPTHCNSRTSRLTNHRALAGLADQY